MVLPVSILTFLSPPPTDLAPTTTFGIDLEDVEEAADYADENFMDKCIEGDTRVIPTDSCCR